VAGDLGPAEDVFEAARALADQYSLREDDLTSVLLALTRMMSAAPALMDAGIDPVATRRALQARLRESGASSSLSVAEFRSRLDVSRRVEIEDLIAAALEIESGDVSLAIFRSGGRSVGESTEVLQDAATAQVSIPHATFDQAEHVQAHHVDCVRTRDLAGLETAVREIARHLAELSADLAELRAEVRATSDPAAPMSVRANAPGSPGAPATSASRSSSKGANRQRRTTRSRRLSRFASTRRSSTRRRQTQSRSSSRSAWRNHRWWSDRGGNGRHRARRRLWQSRRQRARAELHTLFRPSRPEPWPAQPLETASEREKKFYLAISDPIVDAPSIGPRTAARLEPVGIHTVRDLMTADLDEAADRIGARHIT
ncbi:MAG: hypothetical protein AAFO62_12215, partial [Pseudomonadota bacterium]